MLLLIVAQELCVIFWRNINYLTQAVNSGSVRHLEIFEEFILMTAVLGLLYFMK